MFPVFAFLLILDGENMVSSEVAGETHTREFIEARSPGHRQEVAETGQRKVVVRVTGHGAAIESVEPPHPGFANAGPVGIGYEHSNIEFL